MSVINHDNIWVQKEAQAALHSILRFRRECTTINILNDILGRPDIQVVQLSPHILEEKAKDPGLHDAIVKSGCSLSLQAVVQ
jgi:hypothetical protein